MGTKLSISHIRQLFSLTDRNEINYYADQISKRNLSKRQLEEIIKNKEYERLSVETKNKLINDEKIEVKDLVQKYMNYIDKNIKELSNNNTIGILICKRENKFVIEYCSDERIVVRKYELV